MINQREKIAKEISESNGLPMELNLSVAYKQILQEIKKEVQSE